MSPPDIDHVIYLVPDLIEACDDLEQRLGTRPAIGGRHPQYGTHNALLSLGERSYLEVMAHDASLPAPAEGVLFGADAITEPRVVTWVLAVDDIRSAMTRAQLAGVVLGEASPGHRERPDGEVLRWVLSDPRADRFGGVVPFLIDWGNTPHPARSAPRVGEVTALRMMHPDAEEVSTALHALGVDVVCTPGDRPTLRVTIATSAGSVVLE